MKLQLSNRRNMNTTLPRCVKEMQFIDEQNEQIRREITLADALLGLNEYQALNVAKCLLKPNNEKTLAQVENILKMDI